jgi:beta-galactosidase
MFHRVNQILKNHNFVDLRRQADVLLLANREYDRLEAASVLVSFPGDFLETPSGFSEYPTFMTVSEKTLGFQEPIQMAKSNWFTGVYSGLTKTGYPFLLSDTALKPERWQRFKALVLSSYEYLAAGLQKNLVEYAKGGGTVVLGPKVPTLDEQMKPDETLLKALKTADQQPLKAGNAEIGTVYAIGKGKIIHVTDWADPARSLEAALHGLGLVHFSRNDPRLDVTLHRSAGDPRRVIVFLANPSADPILANIELDFEMKSIKELWSGRTVSANGKKFSDALPAYTIYIYECTL